MTEDILRELRQFQQYTQNLQRLMSDMRDMMPPRSEGTDAQGAVRVRVGPDGLPESVGFVADWQRRRGPEEVGQAVLEAYGAALGERMERWSTAVSASDWQADAQRLDGGPDGFAAADTSGRAPGPDGPDLRYVVPRRLDEVAEEALSAFDAVERLGAEPAEGAEATGTSAARRVAVTVTRGALVSCEADAEWAARQSSVGLNQALDEALTAARSKLAEAEARAAAAGDALAGPRLDGLLNEALAILGDPSRHTD